MKSHNLRVHQKIYGNILVGLSFFALTLITIKILLPNIKTKAESQIAEQTVGPYEMSMANDSVTTINITPTAVQTVYAASNNITVKNTCDAGATIDMTMESSTSNSLIRAGADTATKEISATTSTGLDDYSWGYTLDNSSYYAIPKKGETAAIIYDESTAQPTELSVPVKFGVKTDNSLPSGAYTNDVVYTMTPKAGCLVYDIIWDYGGGTAKSDVTYPTSLGWGDTVDLSQLTPTREGYTFAGWTNGSSNFADSETAANLNPSNAKSVTVKALWELSCSVSDGTIYNFDYTGGIQTFSSPCDGYYKLEVWGAQGGGNSTWGLGGNGGYSIGVLGLEDNSILYIYVGQKGYSDSVFHEVGGWNGGGGNSSWSTYHQPTGGGATDISLHGTENSTYYNNENHYYSRIIVAGGGGGGANGREITTGGSGGGETGILGTGFRPHYHLSAGSQTAGGSGNPDNGHQTSDTTGQFGYNPTVSAHKTSWDLHGGGGGWYGGGLACDTGGAGGSGWIYTASTYSYWAANSTEGKSGKWLLDSSYYLTSASTYDGGTIFKSPSGTDETGHSGNGYARITYLGASI